MVTNGELQHMHRVENALDRMADALVKIAKPDESVAAMRKHAAETDHVLELRLLDLDVFGVRCPHCPTFHLEWRTK